MIPLAVLGLCRSSTRPATSKAGRKYDERKLLGLPTGHERPDGATLVRLAKECGYKLRGNAGRKAALDAIADGKMAQRKLLQAAVRLEMNVPDEAPAKGTAKAASNGSTPAQVPPEAMKEAIRRKGYQGDVPGKGAELVAMYDSIVGNATIPHSYPTGTRLQDEVDRPWTELAVTPAKGQKRATIEVTVQAPQGGAQATRRAAQAANRRGQLVSMDDGPTVDGNAHTFTIVVIPAGATAAK